MAWNPGSLGGVSEAAARSDPYDTRSYVEARGLDESIVTPAIALGPEVKSRGCDWTIGVRWMYDRTMRDRG